MSSQPGFFFISISNTVDFCLVRKHKDEAYRQNGVSNSLSHSFQYQENPLEGSCLSQGVVVITLELWLLPPWLGILSANIQSHHPKVTFFHNSFTKH